MGQSWWWWSSVCILIHASNSGQHVLHESYTIILVLIPPLIQCGLRFSLWSFFICAFLRSSRILLLHIKIYYLLFEILKMKSFITVHCSLKCHTLIEQNWILLCENASVPLFRCQLNWFHVPNLVTRHAIGLIKPSHVLFLSLSNSITSNIQSNCVLFVLTVSKQFLFYDWDNANTKKSHTKWNEIKKRVCRYKGISLNCNGSFQIEQRIIMYFICLFRLLLFDLAIAGHSNCFPIKILSIACSWFISSFNKFR